MFVGTDEHNGLTFVGVTSPMNLRGVPHGSRPRPRGPCVCQFTDEHRPYQEFKYRFGVKNRCPPFSPKFVKIGNIGRKPVQI
jgi:hypothetical protein